MRSPMYYRSHIEFRGYLREGAMNRRLPKLAILLGLAGLIPFIVFGLAVMGAAPDRAGRWLGVLMAYGAVVLAFLGGVHWGFALDEAAPVAGASRTERVRLLLGLVSPLIAWLALVLVFVAPADVGLAVLIAGYIASAALEDQARRRGAMPSGYMWLRWALSVVVVALLVTVLVLRLLGARVIF